MAGPDEETFTLPEDDEERQVGGNAGSLDDEGGNEASGSEDSGAEGQEGLEAEEERPPTRGERRFQKLSEEVRASRERADQLERTLAELRQGSQQQQQPQGPKFESDQEFAARLAMMEPEQRIEARLERSEKRHQYELLVTRMQMAESQDIAKFQGMAAANPLFKKVASEVEQVRRTELQRGRDIDRETIATYLLGRKLLESKGKIAEARSKGADNIRREQARPDTGRSDVRPERRGTDARSNLEKRLTGVLI